MPVKIFPPPGIVFPKKDGKSAHAAQCSKSRLLTKVIDKIPDIDSFRP